MQKPKKKKIYIYSESAFFFPLWRREKKAVVFNVIIKG